MQLETRWKVERTFELACQWGAEVGEVGWKGSLYWLSVVLDIVQRCRVRVRASGLRSSLCLPRMARKGPEKVLNQLRGQGERCYNF